VCFEERGEIKCEREEERMARELEEKLRKYIEDKLKELTEQYEIEVTLDPQTLKGAGRWKRKKSSQ
jgi:hypothetical protein